MSPDRLLRAYAAPFFFPAPGGKGTWLVKNRELMGCGIVRRVAPGKFEAECGAGRIGGFRTKREAGEYLCEAVEKSALSI